MRWLVFGALLSLPDTGVEYPDIFIILLSNLRQVQGYYIKVCQ
jgi:hypothetical protein